MLWVLKTTVSQSDGSFEHTKHMFVCLFVLLLYAPSQQLWPWRDSQFTLPHFFLGKLEQAVNQYFVHIISLVTDNNPRGQKYLNIALVLQNK